MVAKCIFGFSENSILGDVYQRERRKIQRQIFLRLFQLLNKCHLNYYVTIGASNFFRTESMGMALL